MIHIKFPVCLLLSKHGSWCFYPSSRGASGPRKLTALVSLAAVLLRWRHPRQKKTVSHFKMFWLFLLILLLSFSRVSNSGFLQPQSPKYIWNSLSKSKKHEQAHHKASPGQEDEAKGTAARRMAPPGPTQPFGGSSQGFGGCPVQHGLLTLPTEGSCGIDGWFSNRAPQRCRDRDRIGGEQRRDRHWAFFPSNRAALNFYASYTLFLRRASVAPNMQTH